MQSDISNFGGGMSAHHFVIIQRAVLYLSGVSTRPDEVHFTLRAKF